MMKNIRNIAVAAIMTIASTLVISASSAAVAGASPANCTIVPGGNLFSGRYFDVNNSTATAQFTVEGDANCTETVTLASWEANQTFLPLSAQTLFAHTTATFGVGNHTIQVAIPNCYFQTDLLSGTSPTAADGTANYQSGLISFLQSGSNDCVQPTPVPTPTPTPVTPASAVVTPTPTQLVNTGPGQVIGLFGTATVAGAIAHKLYVRRQKRA